MGNSHPNQIKAGRGLIDVEKVITYKAKFQSNGWHNMDSNYKSFNV